MTAVDMGNRTENFMVKEGHRNQWILAWLSPRLGAKVHILRTAAQPQYGKERVGAWDVAEAYCGSSTTHNTAGIASMGQDTYGFVSWTEALEQADCQRCLKTFQREVYWMCPETGKPCRMSDGVMSYVVNWRSRQVLTHCIDCQRKGARPL